jgi:hypothetical protein
VFFGFMHSTKRHGTPVPFGLPPALGGEKPYSYSKRDNAENKNQSVSGLVVIASTCEKARKPGCLEQLDGLNRSGKLSNNERRIVFHGFAAGGKNQGTRSCLAKVVLIGDALGLSRGFENRPLIYPTLYPPRP